MEDTKTYIRGFNVGYSFKQNQPKLFEKLANAVQGENQYMEGFKAGGQQYDKERGQELLKARRGQSKQNQQDRTRDLER